MNFFHTQILYHENCFSFCNIPSLPVTQGKFRVEALSPTDWLNDFHTKQTVNQTGLLFLCVCMSACSCACMFVCSCVRMYVCVQVYVCVCMCGCLCVCLVHVCECMYGEQRLTSQATPANVHLSYSESLTVLKLFSWARQAAGSQLCVCPPCPGAGTVSKRQHLDYSLWVLGLTQVFMPEPQRQALHG